ncbi:MAG: tetratricopeptide repeat protein [Thermonemataceae bacterium]
MRHTIFSVICILYAFGTLLQAQPNPPSNAKKIKQLLSSANVEEQPQKAILLATEALTQAQEAAWPIGEREAYYLLATLYQQQDAYTSAYQHYNKALAISKEMNDRKSVGRSLLGIGEIYVHWSEYDTALQHLLQAKEIFEELKEPLLLATTLNALGALNDHLEAYDKELTYLRQALTIYQAMDDQKGVSKTYNNLGTCYLAKKYYARALDYYEKSKTLSQTLRDTNTLAVAYNHMGDTYFQQTQYKQAKRYYETSLQYYKTTTDTKGLGTSLYNLGRVYKAAQDYENAVLLFSKALQNFKQLQAKYLMAQTYFEIYDTYKRLANHEQALEYHELYKQLQDSIFNEKVSHQVKEMEARFQLKAQQKQIALLQSEKEREKKYLYIVGAFAAIILILLIFLYKRFVQGRKLNQALQRKNEQIAAQNSELVTSEKQLKELVETKDKFFSIISHDLRGPLNSLTGFLQVLIKHPQAFTQEEIVSFAQKIDASVINLKNLLENLLQWARSQTGNMDFEPEKVALQEILEETYQVLGDTAKNKLIGLHIIIEGEPVAFADKNMMRFVIRNIVSNAIKFTPKGGMITTTIKRAEHQVIVDITDNGVGMSEEVMGKLFRLDVSQSQKGTDDESGTGLGLILCQEFVKKNGGEITVHSVLNEGTTFSFTVPSEKIADTALPVASA